MKKFRVQWSETLYYDEIIEAKNKNEALTKFGSSSFASIDNQSGDIKIDEIFTPTKEEIKEYMESHNNDEVGIDNQWSMEDAEYYLSLSDKYHYKNYKNK